MDGQIHTRSTSAATSNATLIVLERTERKRLQFLPCFIDNPHDRQKCLSGKILYEKKKENDSEFPSDIGDKSIRLARGSVKAGDWMEIELKRSYFSKDFLSIINSTRILAHPPWVKILTPR